MKFYYNTIDNTKKGISRHLTERDMPYDKS